MLKNIGYETKYCDKLIWIYIIETLYGCYNLIDIVYSFTVHELLCTSMIHFLMFDTMNSLYNFIFIILIIVH